MASHISRHDVSGAPKLRVTAIPSWSAPEANKRYREAYRRYATRHRHERPRIIRVEHSEIMAFVSAIFISLKNVY